MTKRTFASKIQEQEITLRAAEELPSLNVVGTDGVNQAQKESRCEERSIGSAPEDLLDVITDPNATEQDWLYACNELDRRERKIQRHEFDNRQSRRRATHKKLAVAALILAISAATSWIYFSSSKLNNETAAAKVEPTEMKDVDFGPYMSRLQKVIRSHWHPPSSSVQKTITVQFKVSKSGEISNVGFVRLSRDSEADAAALKSVIESMPTSPPLPEGSPDSIDICFTFDYELGKKN